MFTKTKTRIDFRNTIANTLIEWMSEPIQQWIEAQLRLLHILIQNQPDRNYTAWRGGGAAFTP